jgi:hypothetical protein
VKFDALRRELKGVGRGETTTAQIARIATTAPADIFPSTDEKT